MEMPQEIIIEPERMQRQYLKDIYRYRELFYFFAWRDIIVRYKQTFFGIAWALLRPILNMAIFAFIFGKIAKLPSAEINYPLFVLSGLLPWQLFSSTVSDSGNSLANNSHMISKIYFPRLLIPCSAIMVNFVDFLISLVLITPFFLFFTGLSSYFFLFPLCVIQTLILCVGAGLWLSALTVRFRDFRFIIPFFIQFGLFISPVGYATFIIPEKWRLFYMLNPMTGLIDFYRFSFFGMHYPSFEVSIGVSICLSFLILVSGFRYFRRMERVFADII